MARRFNPNDLIRKVPAVPPAVQAPPPKALMGIVLHQVGPDGRDILGSEVFAGLTQEPAVMREILAILEKHAKFDQRTGRPMTCVLPKGREAVDAYEGATLALDALLADEQPAPESERTMDVKACEAEREAYQEELRESIRDEMIHEDPHEDDDGLGFLAQVAL